MDCALRAEPLTCVQNMASTEAWWCSFLRDPQGLQVTYPQKVKMKYFRKQLLLQEKTYINKQGNGSLKERARTTGT